MSFSFTNTMTLGDALGPLISLLLTILLTLVTFKVKKSYQARQEKKNYVYKYFNVSSSTPLGKEQIKKLEDQKIESLEQLKQISQKTDEDIYVLRRLNDYIFRCYLDILTLQEDYITRNFNYFEGRETMSTIPNCSSLSVVKLGNKPDNQLIGWDDFGYRDRYAPVQIRCHRYHGGGKKGFVVYACSKVKGVDYEHSMYFGEAFQNHRLNNQWKKIRHKFGRTSGASAMQPSASFQVGLSQHSPIGDTVPKGAQGVVVMAFDINASCDEQAQLEQIILLHQGDSVQDIEGVYLAINGARVTDVESFDANSNKALLRLANSLLIDVDESVTIDVCVDFSRGAGAGGQHQVSIENDECFVSDLRSIIGSFPIQGEQFEVGREASGLISLRYTNFSGGNAIGRFSVSTDLTEDQTLYSITLQNCGDLSDGDFKNIYLTDSRDTVLSNTVSQTVGDYVTLVFDPPITILAGSTVDIFVRADVEASGSIVLQLEEDNDLFGVGSQYGFGQNGQLYGSSVRIEGQPFTA